MRVHLRIVRLPWVAAFVLLGSACEDGTVGPGVGSEIRILLNNQSGRAFSVTMDGPSFSPTTFGTCSGFCSGEVPGVVGDVITFDAFAPAGSNGPAISGNGNCRAGADIVGTPPHAGTSAYGQVDFALSGTTILLVCSSGWQ